MKSRMDGGQDYPFSIEGEMMYVYHYAVTRHNLLKRLKQDLYEHKCELGENLLNNVQPYFCWILPGVDFRKSDTLTSYFGIG